jgi:hypothetical protein
MQVNLSYNYTLYKYPGFWFVDNQCILHILLFSVRPFVFPWHFVNTTPLKPYDKICWYLVGMLFITCSWACYAAIIHWHILWNMWLWLFRLIFRFLKCETTVEGIPLLILIYHMDNILTLHSESFFSIILFNVTCFSIWTLKVFLCESESSIDNIKQNSIK